MGFGSVACSVGVTLGRARTETLAVARWARRLHRIAAEHANVHGALRRRHIELEGEQVGLHRGHFAEA